MYIMNFCRQNFLLFLLVLQHILEDECFVLLLP
nr:MAG TPA: hypothetical protein [Caudoviricetes sp.]DAV60214.1 MAG TPA: hypothetical protein [Caudoviricetes sp.]